MTSEFTAAMDAATDHRCACLCGTPITDASPSAYFASELCAARWHRPARLAYAREVAVMAARAWIKAARMLLAEAFRVLNTALCEVAKVLTPAFERARRFAALIQTPAVAPAVDPMARALSSRRPLGTGPAARPPVPRRLDPGTGLWPAARGRQPFRPVF